MKLQTHAHFVQDRGVGTDRASSIVVHVITPAHQDWIRIIDPEALMKHKGSRQLPGTLLKPFKVTHRAGVVAGPHAVGQPDVREIGTATIAVNHNVLPYGLARHPHAFPDVFKPHDLSRVVQSSPGRAAVEISPPLYSFVFHHAPTEVGEPL